MFLHNGEKNPEYYISVMKKNKILIWKVLYLKEICLTKSAKVVGSPFRAIDNSVVLYM